MKPRRYPFAVVVLAVSAACAAPTEDPAVAVASRSPAPAAAADSELLPNARRPEEGLVSGGQPSLEQLRAIRDAGFRTVVNLRAEGEPGTGAEEVEALGMTYVALPIRGAAGVTEENARAFAELLAEVERPAIVHCASGNRVGAMFALKAFHVDGLGVEEAMARGDSAGLTRLRDDVLRHLEAASGG